MPTARRLTALAGCLVAAMVLTGCAGGGDIAAGGGDQGFVAGDGSIVLIPPDQRVVAPALSGPTLDGGSFDLARQRGDVVVFNIWASWCAPCRAEAPDLARLSRDFADDDVRFVGLNTRDSDVAARAFVAKYALDYPNVIDRDGQLQLLFADSLPPQAIPSTLVIDREGRVAARVLGRSSEATVRGLVESLLAESS